MRGIAVKIILPSELSGVASQWGSFITNGDPGACMYGFSSDGLVQNEDHRRACLAYIKEHCRKAADANVAAGDDPDSQHPELDALTAYLETCPVQGSANLDAFTSAYVQAALFSTNDESDESGGNPLDDNYGPEHLSPDALAIIKAECARFQEFYGEHFTEENCTYTECSVDEYAAHDFWLTRNGHGAGFWDGDWNEPVATLLTEAAKSFGSCDLVVGDDGMIHVGGREAKPEKVEEATATPKP
jgi:hypothetical protein